MTLRQMAIAALTQRGEALTYRELIDAIWAIFPAYRLNVHQRRENEQEARRELRVRLGMEVRNHPEVFTATKSEGVVIIGLAATELDNAEEFDEEEQATDVTATPAVYWYTFPAYQTPEGPFPIKIGRGNNPEMRISQQVTAMPEQPLILGKFEHEDTHTLERAIHAILRLRGKRKEDAPGAEWFLTTPDEIENLIQFVISAHA